MPTSTPLESLPLLSLPTRARPSSRMLKRAMDIVGATVALVVTAPLFVYIAWKVKRRSPRPDLLPARAAGHGTGGSSRSSSSGRCTPTSETAAHREYIKATMNGHVEPARTVFTSSTAATPSPASDAGCGRRASTNCRSSSTSSGVTCRLSDLARASPTRPSTSSRTTSSGSSCPQGMTGLWQVTARAHSTFGEALDIDVPMRAAGRSGSTCVCCSGRRSQLLRPTGTV